MRAFEFYDRVTSGGGAVIEDLLGLFEENGIRYCVIGGQAVNRYAEPLVSLDLDLVVATDSLEAAEALLSERFVVRRFPYSLNVYPGESDLRVQIQTDPRYAEFVERAEKGDVLGMEMYVASARDVLRGKVWAALDPSRRPGKRRKDLLDIGRLVEAEPALRELVPPELLERLEP